MSPQKQHNPKRFEGLHPSQFYEYIYCGIKYIGIKSYQKHMQDKHTRPLTVRGETII